jgi:hypothetical protein
VFHSGGEAKVYIPEEELKDWEPPKSMTQGLRRRMLPTEHGDPLEPGKVLYLYAKYNPSTPPKSTEAEVDCRPVIVVRADCRPVIVVANCPKHEELFLVPCTTSDKPLSLGTISIDIEWQRNSQGTITTAETEEGRNDGLAAVVTAIGDEPVGISLDQPSHAAFSHMFSVPYDEILNTRKEP